MMAVHPLAALHCRVISGWRQGRVSVALVYHERETAEHRALFERIEPRRPAACGVVLRRKRRPRLSRGLSYFLLAVFPFPAFLASASFDLTSFCRALLSARSACCLAILAFSFSSWLCNCFAVATVTPPVENE